MDGLRGYRRLLAGSVLVIGISGLLSCGGGSTGTAQDSGANKTYLSVAASDPDGDTLHYQWRVTGGTIDNRDAPQTVWTMPDGPGLHFAYVVVTDGKGGYAEQQYAVSSDALGTVVAPKAPVSHPLPTTASDKYTAGRVRVRWANVPEFAVPGSNSTAQRYVYLPDTQVQLLQGSNVLFSGTTDLSGELSLPDLAPGNYDTKCTTDPDAAPAPCGFGISVSAIDPISITGISFEPTNSRNLRLYGHVALADGGVCGLENEFFSLQRAATVQLLASDGSAASPIVRVNRFGDYAIDAAVLALGHYQLKIDCDGYSATVVVPPSPNAFGYVASAPIELSHQIANTRPTIAKVVATGPEGNVRGQMITPEAGTSNALPGWRQFLAYKGHDTKISACQYYLSLGAVGGCDAQGNLQDPITLDDWKRAHKFKPYDSGNTEVSAVYINRMDLNLVRRMLATKVDDNNIAFVVCNSPGPDTSAQTEVDLVVDVGLADQKRVACVAMEYSTSPGNVNGGKPFTKFLTFGPDGSLLPSINLDGRGEKYMPGACVACHGGTQYNGRFSANGAPSPFLGSGFLPFDTGNYLFSSHAGLTEADQSQALYDLNKLVQLTDVNSATKATTALIDGWYKDTGIVLNKQYVPPDWQVKATSEGNQNALKFYREVIGGVCRTCHVAMGSSQFNWDTNVGVVTTPTGIAHQHFCGGTPDVALNASMPNALISRDRLADRIQADPQLLDLMQTYLGCVAPMPDPAYAKK